jgi:hypothetical protein
MPPRKKKKEKKRIKKGMMAVEVQPPWQTAVSFSFFFFDMRGIIVYSCHLCYLFDGKVDEDLKIKVTINLDLKIIKLEIG